MAGGFETGCIGHVRRVVDAADHIFIVGAGPFQKNPSIQVFQKSVAVLKLFKIVQQSENTVSQFGN